MTKLSEISRAFEIAELDGPKDVVLFCPHCDASHVFKPEGQVHHSDPGTVLELWSCGHCHRPVLTSADIAYLQHRDSFEQRLDSRTRREVWPSPFPESRLAYSEVPRDVYHAYAQAHQCFRAGLFDAAALMARLSLEALGKDKKFPEKASEQKLDKWLKENSFISDEVFRWSKKVRKLGNDTAHKTSQRVARKEAMATLDVTEAVIYHVYVLSEHLNRLPEPEKPTR